MYTFDPTTGKWERKKVDTDWQDFQQSVDRKIQSELRGEAPFAGATTWKEYWSDWVAALRESKRTGGKRLDYDRAVAYIIQRRREAGLPELEGEMESAP